MENFLRICLLAVRLGKILGVSQEDLVDIYYLSLIQHLGCTAYADDTAAVFGDDLATNTWLLTVDQGRPSEMLGALFQHIDSDKSALHRAQHIMHILMTMPKKAPEVFAGRCEVAQSLAERVGLGTRVRDGLGQIYERWDGKGLPNKLKGEAILLSKRVV